MNYKTVSAKAIDVARLTDPKELEQLKRSWAIRANENDIAYKAACVIWERMCADAISLWGRKSAVHKYVLSHKVPKPPNITVEWEALMRKFASWQRKEAKRIEKERLIEAARAKARDYRNRRKQAVEVLEDNGYERGKHFGESYAISFGKQVLVETPEGNIVRGLPAKVKDN